MEAWHTPALIQYSFKRTPMRYMARMVEESIARNVKKLMVTAASALAQKESKSYLGHKRTPISPVYDMFATVAAEVLAERRR